MNKIDTNRPVGAVPPWIIAWLLGGAFVVLMLVFDYRASNGVVIGSAEIWPRDYVNMWAGGKLIAARDFATLYTPAAFSAFQNKLFGPVGPHVYSYPPTAFPIADAFARLPYVPSALLWLGATSAFFAWAARPWWPEKAGWWGLVLFTPAALINIWSGHFAFLIGGLFLMAWRVIDARPVVAGVLIGLLAIKPQYAVLFPLALMLRKDWRVIAAAAATVAVMIATTALVYGNESWMQFLTRATGKQVSVIDAHGTFFGKMSGSAATAILDLGGGWTLAIIGQAALAALGIGLVAMAVRKRAATRDLALLVSTATFLVLPYSLNYDLVVPMIAAWTIMVGPQTRPVDRTLATIGFVAPQVGIVLALAGLPVTALMIAALAVAQYRVACAPR